MYPKVKKDSPWSGSLASLHEPSLAVKSSWVLGISAWAIMFSTGVLTGLGVTVLIWPKARPSNPSPLNCWNWAEIFFASSTACFSTLKPPMTTVSVPTLPEAEDWSP